MDFEKIDFKKIKDDFPIFSKSKKSGHNFVYLDSAATTHKPQVVIDSLVDFYTLHNANVHRGLYDSGEQATTLYEGARKKVANFINAKTSEVIFTSGTTESINFIAQTWASSNLKPGDEILLTQAEHHANLLPWQRVAKQTGAILKFIPINPKTFKVENPASCITSKTKLVAITYISNVLDDIWDRHIWDRQAWDSQAWNTSGESSDQLEDLIKKAKAHGVKILIDAAQAVAHRKIDVQELDVDFMAFSGHKMFAPTGIGVLYIKSNFHDQIKPYRVGGGMVHSVSFNDASWAQAPHKFEAGTPAIASAIGLGAAIDYISKNLDFEQIAKHETALSQQLLEELIKIKKIKIAVNNSAFTKDCHLICFSVDGVHAHDIAGYIGDKGISVRAGHHCAQPLINLLGFESLVRVSFGVYNTAQDVEAFMIELNEVLKVFGVI